MGDRAHVVIHDRDETVAFYTHWAGTELPDVLRAALHVAQKGQRLEDPPYLARIIFCHMVADEGLDDTTGYGISQKPFDGREIHINCDEQTIQGSEFDIPLMSLVDFIKGYDNGEGQDEEADDDDHTPG